MKLHLYAKINDTLTNSSITQEKQLEPQCKMNAQMVRQDSETQHNSASDSSKAA